MTDYSKMDIIMSLQFSYSNKRNKEIRDSFALELFS